MAGALLCNSACSNRSSTPIRFELIWQTRTATVMPWIAFDRTGSRLTYGSGYYQKGVVRHQINILNTESLVTESLVKGQDECFCFLPNGSLLFSDSSGRAWICDLSSSMSKRLHRPANVFTRYAVSQDGKYLATVVNIGDHCKYGVCNKKKVICFPLYRYLRLSQSSLTQIRQFSRPPGI